MDLFDKMKYWNHLQIEECVMSMDKAITNSKEHCKPYRGAKAIDRTCRTHGSCGWCKENRTYRNDKRELRTIQELNDYLEE